MSRSGEPRCNLVVRVHIVGEAVEQDDRDAAGAAALHVADVERRRLDAALRGRLAETGGEIQLTDAMAKLIGEQPFHALKVKSVRYDCGDKIGFVIANLAMALQRDDVAPSVREYLSSVRYGSSSTSQ